MSKEPTASPEFESFWSQLREDAEAIADEYRDAGWDVLLVDPGDVTPLYDTDKPFGLSVLVPEPQFETVTEWIDRMAFDRSELYRRTTGPLVFLLVVEEAPDAETAVLIPAYYNHVTHDGLLAVATENDEMRVHVRALSSDDPVTFRHDDPSLFAPDRDGS